MFIRNAFLSDLDRLSDIESQCYSPAEAASGEQIKERLKVYPNHFWLMTDDEKVVSFIDGLVTDLPDLTDEMYERADMHNEHGKWQMLLGVNTIPEYRSRGLASELIRHAAEDCIKQGRLGLVLTCKDRLLDYYSRLGFVSEGVSQSVHGNAKWYQMRLNLYK